MKEKVIIAIISTAIAAVAGILLPETVKAFLRNLIVHFCVRYVFNWVAIVVLLLIVVVAYFVFKVDFSYFSKLVISLLILALAILLPIITVKVYWRFHGPPSSFTIGVCNFFAVNENGKLCNSKQGTALKQFILKYISDINNLENNTYAKIIKPNIIEINPTDFEILSHSSLSLADLLKDNFVDKRAHIIIWGIISENGEIEKVNISYNKGLFYEEGVLKLKIADYFKRFDDLVVKLCRNKPPLDKAQIVANLFYAIISQTPSISTASQYKDISVGLKLLDESQKLWNKSINTYVSSTELSGIYNLSSFFEIGYNLNRAALFKNAARSDEEIEAIYQILEKNPFFPLSTYEDFKKEYDLYYTSEVASKSLEFAKNDNSKSEEEKKRLSFKEKLYKYEGPYFLIDYFTQLIVVNAHYESNLGYYEKLATHHSREPLIYLFWGDAIKLYKSEPFALNLARVDAAIEKYKFAEQLDPEWPLIGSKIFVVSFLHFLQEQELGHRKKASQLKAVLEAYKEKQEKYGKTLEVKKFFND